MENSVREVCNRGEKKEDKGENKEECEKNNGNREEG